MAAPRKELEELHRLVDELSAEDVPRARDLLARVRLERSLAEAPDDDEPVTDEDREAVREGWDAYERGDVVSHEEVMREFGLDSDRNAS